MYVPPRTQAPRPAACVAHDNREGAGDLAAALAPAPSDKPSIGSSYTRALALGALGLAFMLAPGSSSAAVHLAAGDLGLAEEDLAVLLYNPVSLTAAAVAIYRLLEKSSLVLVQRVLLPAMLAGGALLVVANLDEAPAAYEAVMKVVSEHPVGFVLSVICLKLLLRNPTVLLTLFVCGLAYQAPWSYDAQLDISRLPREEPLVAAASIERAAVDTARAAAAGAGRLGQSAVQGTVDLAGQAARSAVTAVADKAGEAAGTAAANVAKSLPDPPPYMVATAQALQRAPAVMASLKAPLEPLFAPPAEPGTSAAAAAVASPQQQQAEPEVVASVRAALAGPAVLVADSKFAPSSAAPASGSAGSAAAPSALVTTSTPTQAPAIEQPADKAVGMDAQAAVGPSPQPAGVAAEARDVGSSGTAGTAAAAAAAQPVVSEVAFSAVSSGTGAASASAKLALAPATAAEPSPPVTAAASVAAGPGPSQAAADAGAVMQVALGEAGSDAATGGGEAGVVGPSMLQQAEEGESRATGIASPVMDIASGPPSSGEAAAGPPSAELAAKKQTGQPTEPSIASEALQQQPGADE